MTGFTKNYISFEKLRTKLGGRSRSSIYRDVERGHLPAPLKIGHRVFWIEQEIDEFLNNQRIS